MLVMCDGLRGYLLMRIVMERDYRITGKFRGQSDAVEAPVGFEGWQTYPLHVYEMLTLFSKQQMEGWYSLDEATQADF